MFTTKNALRTYCEDDIIYLGWIHEKKNSYESIIAIWKIYGIVVPLNHSIRITKHGLMIKVLRSVSKHQKINEGWKALRNESMRRGLP